MPTVQFVQEHVTVEAQAGRRLSDVAADHGILVCRQLLGWTRLGDYSVWIQGEPGSTNPPTFGERMRGVSGWRRLANRVVVLGDLRVWTQQGLGSRNGGSRKIDATPQPATDAAAQRRPDDEAGTAQYPYGNPLFVGRGTPPAAADPAPAPEAAAKGPDKAAAKKADVKAPAEKAPAEKADAKAPAEKADAKAPAEKADAKKVDAEKADAEKVDAEKADAE